ncbi:SDR family oxidoreductase [Pseudomonas capeferrum]|uniref:UDP-glucose 4-epimerase family protein n=1 Tax=Pseudomonas capeferrum TaxID=1495066 RepID=UPI0015E3A9B1|nr:SDR family oxidoreductase [Pseudomonas capeferrum]MBA1204420.1 SDR family oxidoreductase [Pseudomonas capeferrum]
MGNGAVLVTGANGFVGRALVAHLLAKQSRPVVAAVRRSDAEVPAGAKKVIVAGLGPRTDWLPSLTDVEIVVHTAARVHVMNDAEADPLQQFRLMNTQGTLALAEQAAKAGVRRFVFISSIKVNGEDTLPDRPFTADDAPRPVDPYGVSKLEAEEGLRQLARVTGMEVVIIRPVLVYGPGVGANMASLMRWLNRCAPLPLGAVENRRSLVGLPNLVDFVDVCIEHPKAANEVFLVSDGEDVSTPELLRRVSRALGRPVVLLPVPTGLLRLAGRLIGKSAAMQRLLGSLHVDISKNEQLLGWKPKVPLSKALQATADYFLESHKC